MKKTIWYLFNIFLSLYVKNLFMEWRIIYLNIIIVIGWVDLWTWSSMENEVKIILAIFC